MIYPLFAFLIVLMIAYAVYTRSVIARLQKQIGLERERAAGLAQDSLKFKLAVENASDHIIITDPEGIMLYANKAAETTTGYSVSEMIGKKAGTLWSHPMPKEFYKNMWHTMKDEKKTFFGQLQNKRKNGDIYDAQVSIAPVLDDNKNIIFFVGIERDITTAKRIDRAKTEFVSLASHQLKTPLTAISWYIELLLKKETGELNDIQQKYLNNIYSDNKRMVDLVNSLLNVSRIDLGSFAVEPVPTDLRVVADACVQELQQEIDQKKISLHKQYAKDLPMISADPKLINMILQNLLSNAIKYTPEGGTVELDISFDSANMTINVADTGYGIPFDAQPKIFSKLYRADNARKLVPGGNGLGLYIVKSIIDQVGGKIWFESVENKGTSFFVTIPLSGMSQHEGARALG